MEIAPDDFGTKYEAGVTPASETSSTTSAEGSDSDNNPKLQMTCIGLVQSHEGNEIKLKKFRDRTDTNSAQHRGALQWQGSAFREIRHHFVPALHRIIRVSRLS